MVEMTRANNTLPTFWKNVLQVRHPTRNWKSWLVGDPEVKRITGERSEALQAEYNLHHM